MLQSDEALDTFIQKNLHSGNALVGTCAMGLSPDKGAVVDADLKVYGVQNLRVADSSVIPVIPGESLCLPYSPQCPRMLQSLLTKITTVEVVMTAS